MRLASVLMVVACSKSSPPPPPPPPPTPPAAPAAGSANHVAMTPVVRKTPVTKRDELPRAVAKLVPAHGIYAAGGGLTSAPWRIVVDTDAKTIYGGSATKHNAPSFGPMEKEATAPLAAVDQQRLVELAGQVRTEPQPPIINPVIADYDEILVVLDGDAAFFENGFGPIHTPLAAKLIADLRKTAGI